MLEQVPTEPCQRPLANHRSQRRKDPNDAGRLLSPSGRSRWESQVWPRNRPKSRSLRGRRKAALHIDAKRCIPTTYCGPNGLKRSAAQTPSSAVLNGIMSPQKRFSG